MGGKKKEKAFCLVLFLKQLQSHYASVAAFQNVLSSLS